MGEGGKKGRKEESLLLAPPTRACGNFCRGGNCLMAKLVAVRRLGWANGRSHTWHLLRHRGHWSRVRCCP